MLNRNPHLDRLRAAITAGEFSRGLRLWQEYAPAVLTGLKAGPEGAATLEELREFLGWARTSALQFQARAVEDLNSLEVRSRYAAPRRSAPPAVRVLG